MDAPSRARLRGLTLSESSAANRPRERHDVHLPCAGATERGRRRGDGCAGRVDVVDEDDAGRRTVPSARTVATFRRRSARERPRCGRAWRRVSSGSSGRSQRAASSRARASAGWCARSSTRSGSAGTGTSAVAPGGGSSASPTTAAAAAARRRSDRCFQAATSARAASSWTTAARAEAKASRRPAHSVHRRNRPGRRRAAAGAERRPDPPQASEARLARGRPRRAADDAALREQELEHRPTLRPPVSRDRAVTAPRA